MPRNDSDKVNEAVERLTEAMWGSYESAVERTAAMQESNSRFARSLFESNLELLRAQTEIQNEINLHTLQSLADQARQHREAFLELSRESLNAYDGFLDSLSSYYEEVSRESENPEG
jgi:primosomal protein N''